MAINDSSQKTYSQHAVPQNIMDVEFKLIGDLTMRQFTYLMVFGLIAYIIYISAAGVFKLPFTFASILFGLALAFIPIQERGLDEWFINFLKAVYAPTQMVWRKESVLPPAFTYQNLALVKQELITLAPTSSRRKLEEYLELQQKTEQKDRLDIPEREYILKVRQAFAPVTTAVDDYEPENEAPVVYEQEPARTPEFKPFVPSTQPKESEQSQTEQDLSDKGAQKQQESNVPVEFGSKPDLKTSSESKPDAPQAEIIKSGLAARPAVKPTPRPKPQRIATPSDFTFSSITPDRHSGRRFTRVLPSEGQLILPVRGEKVLKTSEDVDIQKDIDDKTAQLNQLLNQIKADTDLVKDAASAKTIKPAEPVKDDQEGLSEAHDVVKKVKEENERLSNEIQKLRTDIQQSNESDEEKRKKQDILDKLEKEKSQTNTDYTALQRQVLELQRRLKEQEDPTAGMNTQPRQPTYAKMQPITNDPNIVSGVVKNNTGDAVSGTVLLIKNHKGESVRALKTNALGQFSISTSLVNGMYTIEVGSSVEGQTFDIITVEVKGEVIPPIEIVGRPV